MMKRITSILTVTLLLLLVASSGAFAEGGKIRFGNLALIPGLSVQGIHDDNIYLGDGSNTVGEKEESDWITHVKPGMMLELTFPDRGKMMAGYQGDFAYYSDNTDNDWETHKGLFSLNYDSPGGLIAGINNTYADAEDPYGSAEQYGIGTLTKRWNNDLASKIGFNFSDRFKILAFYNYYKQDYDNDVRDYTQDYNSNEFGAGFEVKVMPKTWMFLRYYYGTQKYFTHRSGVTSSNDASFDWHRANTGLGWDSGGKLAGELNFGYQWKDYDNRLDVNGNEYDDRNTWIASTSVDFMPTETTTLSVSIARALRQAGSDSNDYFEDTGYGLSVSQKILSKLLVKAGYNYSENDYFVGTRKDDNHTLNASLQFELIKDILKAGAEYVYKEKNSNDPGSDYKDNQFIISLDATY
ncbi:MAG: outer membrane beta-barrel protein [Desulfobacterales bacterium]|nr:outer membrane beta-barrel protein [Desulfobacterales bacterium]